MRGETERHPPRVAVALLQLAIPQGFVREAILGDLHEEYCRRSVSSSRFRARLWFRITAFKLCVKYLIERATHRPGYLGAGGLPSPAPRDNNKGIRLPMFETVLSDIRYAVRTLRKVPGWTAGAVFTLALAIGATTSIFSVVNSVLLKPLGYIEPDRLVALSFTPANANSEAVFLEFGEQRAAHFRTNTTYPNFEEWLEATTVVIQDLAAFDDSWSRDVNFGAGAERMKVAFVSAGAFRALGLPPSLGRWFLDEEDIPGSPNAVILSFRVWQNRFGTRQDVVGQTITIEEMPHTIVGVMPRGFSFPTASSEIWLPMADASRHSGSWNYEVFGRLKPGVTFGQAEALLASRSIESTRRDGTVLTYAATPTPLHTRFVGDVTLMLLIFLSAVSAVLLIACVNVMNLFLTRATHREREHVIRGALGARRSRLMQQLLTESLIVCAVGASIGLLLAFALTDWLVVLSPESIPRKEQIGVDGGALLFTLALALVVGLGVGIAPAFRASKADLAGGLNDSSLGSSGGVRRTRLRDAFVVAQLALALTLLVCGGVLIRSFAALMGLETGADPRHVLVFDTSLPESKYQTFEDRRLFNEEMQSRLRALSGVQTASLAVYFPASGWFHTVDFEVEGYSVGEREEIVAEEKQVTPDYFQTLGIAAIEGRLLNEGDGVTGPEVFVVGESLAKKYWSSGGAVGGRIRTDDEWLSVVGVVNDVKYRGDQKNFPQLYRPYAAGTFKWSMDGLLRVEGDPSQYAGSVRQTIAAMDPDVVVSDLRPLEHFLWDAVSEPRFRALLLGCFGLVAVLLSVVGVYGVMAYAVAQRTREFGIRKALGADQFRTLREVVIRGLGLTGLGVCLGSLGAYAAVGVLQSYLFNVRARDPLTFLLAVGILAFASILACGIPAFRAAKVDPLVALRVS